MQIDNDKGDIYRPEPIKGNIAVVAAEKGVDLKDIINFLFNNNFVLVDDYYSTGLDILNALKKEIFSKHDNSDFKKSRTKRALFQKLSNKVLVPVNKGRINLKKSPQIGWLEILYNDTKDSFYLTMPDVQGLNSSWQWYKNGIKYPPLDFKIHPYYGTYFPTRFEHIELFDEIISSYGGNKKYAVDVGTGCGVLAYILLKHGFKNVFAGDINHNALLTVKETAQKQKFENKITVKAGNLLEEYETGADLIAFNPPWLPGNDKTGVLDSAIYYRDGLFNSFFSQTYDCLDIDGELIVLFSNFAQSAGVTSFHPVEEELKTNSRFYKKSLNTKKVHTKSAKTKRGDFRKDEYVELWRLKKL